MAVITNAALASHTAGSMAAVLGAVAFLPYLRDVLRGHSRPQRAAWWIWAALATVSGFAQAYEGATHSLWFSSVQAGATCVIAVLSIQKGAGSALSRWDWCALLATAIGVTLWYKTDSAAYALALSISVSAIGGVLCVMQAYRSPYQETLCTWVLGTVAAICAVVAVGEWNPVLMAYPAYLCVLYSAMAAAIGFSRVRDTVITLTYAAG